MRAPISFLSAGSVEEAKALLASTEDARIVSGGTAIALFLRQGLIRPRLLIGVARIADLRRIEADGSLHLGAAVPMRIAERAGVVRRRWPLLAETLERIASPRIRNMATIGGSLAHGDPMQDLPPALVVLDARAIVTAAAGDRAIEIRDLYIDYYTTALQPGEMVTRVEIPAIPPGSGAAFLKYAPRSIDDYATASAAALVRLDPDGICRDARLAVGAAGPTVIAVDVLDALVGQRLTGDDLRAASELVRSAVDPIEDVRGSVEYKREMAVVHARRALELALTRATSAPA